MKKDGAMSIQPGDKRWAVCNRTKRALHLEHETGSKSKPTMPMYPYAVFMLDHPHSIW